MSPFNRKKKRKRLSGRAWRLLRIKCLHRDKFRCRQCSAAGKLEVDHIVPLVQGGREHEDNLQALCRDCHIRKTALENTKPRTREEKKWVRLVEDLVTTADVVN